jgi:probable HAF family extracellular repeat protein
VLFVKSIVFLLIFAAAAAANPIYTVAGLGGLGGPASGYAINSAGTVAGWAQNPSGNQQAFISTSNGLKALSAASTDGYAYGINDSGTVVGTTYVNGMAHGTIWSGSGATDLGANSYAMAINNSGQVVGGNGSAFTVVNGQLQSLVTPQGVGWSAAYGINDGGTVVGDGQLANGTFRGMVWSPDGSVIELDTLGGSSSQATDINNSGEVVGFASVSSGYQHAFSMLDGMMIDLGTLGGGSSYAYGINGSGEIVGYSYLAGGGQSAFLYDNGTMLDLNSLLPGNSGWDLLDAYGINASGQITGEGLYDGQLSAFLLTDPPAAVPEPRMPLALGVALAMIALVRMRGHKHRLPRASTAVTVAARSAGWVTDRRLAAGASQRRAAELGGGRGEARTRRGGLLVGEKPEWEQRPTRRKSQTVLETSCVLPRVSGPQLRSA